jgi:hypothetical protein
MISCFFAHFLQHFLKFIMEPSLRDKNETKLAKKVYVVEPRKQNAQEVDFTQLDIVQHAFTYQASMLNYFDHPMNKFIPGMSATCQGKNNNYMGKRQLPSTILQK